MPERLQDSFPPGDFRLRAIFESAAIGIALVNTEGQVVESNPALQRVLGYSAEELEQLSFNDFTHPDHMKADWRLFRELINGERDFYQIEKRYRRKDSQIIWGRLTASLIRSEGGGAPYALGIVEDVTQRKQQEEALQRGLPLWTS